MMLWFWLSANFLISRIIHIETTNEACHGEYPISGMFLKGHTFETIAVDSPIRCQMLCSQDVRCQSYNFIIGKDICELNNRTKEARPEDFADDPWRFYMKGGFSRACLYAFDSQLTASSQWDGNHDPSQGKLNYQESRIKSGAWAAALNNGHQWLQVDLGSQKTVRTLATQGRNYDPDWPRGSHAQWVTKYKLQYSNDGLHFQYYKEQGAVKEFAGNTNRDTEVYHDLNPPVSARYFRFRPTSWHGHISMRVGLFGCPDR